MTRLSELKRQKFAPLHEADRRQYDQRRGSAEQRGYGAAWRARRDAFIEQHPVCCVPGCGRPTDEVDHVVPKARGGADDESNWQPLCQTHHSAKTCREDGGFGHHRARSGLGRVDAGGNGRSGVTDA